MPARVVLVFDEQPFINQAVAALTGAGIQTISFTDPTSAMEALRNAKSVELLITRAEFPAGTQNGMSLALMTKMARPAVKVLFIAKPQYREATRDVADCFMPLPVDISKIVEAASAMLTPGASGALPTNGDTSELIVEELT